MSLGRFTIQLTTVSSIELLVSDNSRLLFAFSTLGGRSYISVGFLLLFFQLFDAFATSSLFEFPLLKYIMLFPFLWLDPDWHSTFLPGVVPGKGPSEMRFWVSLEVSHALNTVPWCVLMTNYIITSCDCDAILNEASIGRPSSCCTEWFVSHDL